MCATPGQHKARGVGSRRALAAVAAIAVALLSLWLYQPEEQDDVPEWIRQSQAFGGSRNDHKQPAVAAPEGVQGNPAEERSRPRRPVRQRKPPGVVGGEGLCGKGGCPAVPDAGAGSGDSGGSGAAAGAGLVLAVQALCLVVYKWAARRHGSANTSASGHQRTLAADLGALLRSGHSADVTFTVGESQLRAHRAVLVARSPVFAAMMAHDCLEASSGHIPVADIEADVLGQLLTFLYTDEIHLDDPLMAQKLLAAAAKYQVPILKEQCELVISQNLCVRNAVACAVLAIEHSCSLLEESAAHFIAAHYQEVMATEEWAEAVHRYPDHVVELSRLVAAASPESR
ncbi:speckle-type POZ protein-like [Schistocerca piceifrons]|uniref:speckle-type POZ protein-like n=1 Tax=Schistocerca piceifrons TaxID=274613 RepID=UPI001F5EB8E9|nr:speckle-type POZ protein-like [Schistocerca piceifrons]